MRHSLWLVALVACGKHAEPPNKSAFDAVYTLDSPPGVSDLSIDASGILWAVPERDRFILKIPAPGAPIIRLPLDGVPDGLDTESLTWLAPGKLAIGTEGQDEATASVLTAELTPEGHVVVTSSRPLTNDELGVTLVNNHGAEGMCGRGDDLLVAIETVGKLANGKRYAPIAHLRAGQLVATSKLALTSETGKISALACTAPDDVYAIERHYGVSRVLHVHFKDGAELAPEVVLDLDPILHGSRNIEGIARLLDGRFALVNDNQGRTVEGPTELFVLPQGAIKP